MHMISLRGNGLVPLSRVGSRVHGAAVLAWPLLRKVSLLLLIAALSAAGLGIRTLAQPVEDMWATPVNLSKSGVASSPAIVILPDGTLRIFWWDPFDGTMVAGGAFASPAAGETGEGESAGEPSASSIAGESWSAPRRATIQIPETVQREGQEVTVLTPIQTMPKIVGAAPGQAHAFWWGEPNADTGEPPLLYSSLDPDSISWSTPRGLAASAGSFDVAADATGTVHLVYVQPRPLPDLPVGLYYRQLPAGGSGWSTPAAVHRSHYLRLLSPEEDHLRLTAADDENLYAAWRGPDQGQVLLTHSADGGMTWEEPEPYLGSGIQPEQDRVIALPGSASALLWTPAGDPGTRIVASDAGDALRLAVWDGSRWSEVVERLLHFEDPESGEAVRFHDLSLVLVPPSAGEEEGVQTLVVVGLDDNGDLWITGASTSALERLLVMPTVEGEPSSAGASAPVNLSASGAASDPAIVVGPDSRLYVFWEDRFDGLTMAEGTILASTVLSGTEKIPTSREVWSPPRAIPIVQPEPGREYMSPEGVPQIVVDAAGGIHAFWLAGSVGEGAIGEEAAGGPLLHNQLAQDASVWSSPAVLAESAAAFDVVADSAGGLHITYIEVGHRRPSPAGVYYRKLEQGNADWTIPRALQQSRYFRLLVPEAAHVRLAVDETDSVYVTWDDPRQGSLMLDYSPDGGTTWQGPTMIGNTRGGSQKGRLVTVPQGEILLLWKEQGSAGPCSLVQAPVREVADGASDAYWPVLEALGVCPGNERFLPLGEEQVLMVLGSGTDALTLAAWDGSVTAGEGQWSEPGRLAFSFEEPGGTRRIYLGNLRVALVEMTDPSGEGSGSKALLVVGTDQDGDVWVTSSEMGALDIIFAPPSPWSPAVNVSQSEAYPDLPAMASDLEGQTHILWSEAASAEEPAAGLIYARWDGEGWTRPAQVLTSPDGGAGEPALVAVGDRLHAVWSSGEGEVFYSHAFIHDAYSPGGWSEPRLLSGEETFASGPDIVADTAGGLHAVFAVAVNEGRGVYYTRSAGGEAWGPASRVFDAAGAGWMGVGQPHLAADHRGVLHVAWVQAHPLASGPPEGAYYARSLDGGETWSEPVEVAPGAYGWPQVVTTDEGRVHLLWQEVNGQGTCWHRLSSDAGQSWMRPERIPGFSNVSAPVRLIADGDGALHLVGRGIDGEGLPTLLYATWDGGRWGTPEAFRLEVDGVEDGIGAAIVPTLFRLDVLFRGRAGQSGEAEERQVDLWHVGRLVPTVAVTPAPTYVPQPTATPTTTPLPTTTARPTPSSSAPSPSTDQDTDLLLPILLAGGGALLIVGAVVGTRVLMAGRR